ncbi:TIGR04255 family protein [Mesorhizobium sp. VK24D]|uniref:TIGR04255 family protein n=1 Tax=Mesorhizobium album TaxID=3072314 RepID=A0ABU4XYU4_9HYPH|nr:TIGR04255 family protein [Mesorhizobium sp. VK24D]MDX8479860.1 TIGR04255 family protein [Mesorhizobium sp. VK24D]
MTDRDFNPLFGAGPEEIPLPAAPLVTVMYQVRFPEIVSIQQKPFIAGFQELVREDYPLLADERLKTVAFDQHVGTVAAADEVIWRFIDETATWRVTLTSTFLTLETRKYVSRADFIERLGKVVTALHRSLKPTHVTRMGMRYVDRVPLTEGFVFDGMLRTEMMAVSGTAIGNSMVHSVSEILCSVQEGQMLARWGMLPARGSHDPDVMPPIKEASWFLDLDTFADHQSSPVRFEADLIRDAAFGLAARSYAFFRWAVTRKFLETFGGVTG